MARCMPRESGKSLTPSLSRECPDALPPESSRICTPARRDIGEDCMGETSTRPPFLSEAREQGSAIGRQRISFDFHWKLFHGGAQLPELADAAWRSADLPHDSSSEGRCSESSPSSGSGGYLPMGAGGSRKRFRRAGSAQSRGL